jgi:bacterioferritin-associated ferredoxin
VSAAGPRSRRPDDGHEIGARSEPAGDDVLVCRCEEVSQAEIMAAIDEGITTMSGLRRRLRIGMGLCQGRTCRRLLAQALAERLGEQPSDVRPGTFRPPVRPVSLRALADEREAPLPPAAEPPAVAADAARPDPAETQG